MIWSFFALMSDTFLSPRNLTMLAIELSVTAVLALGMFLVLLPGQIDLSVGSGVGLIGGLAAVLVFYHSWPALPAMAAGTALALVLWALMGALIVRQRIPAFILTLGGLLIFKGVFWLVIQNSTIPVTVGDEMNLYAALTTYYLPEWMGIILAVLVAAGITALKLRARRRRLGYNFPVEPGEIAFLKLYIIVQAIVLLLIVLHRYRGVPLSVVIFGLVAFAVYVVTRHTPFGRYLYAIGGNEEAAVLSGIPVNRVIITAFAALGALTALTGFMQTAYTGASTTTVGELMELDAIAACVIGGTSLRGGRGTVPGVIFGALIMASLLNGMTLLAISPELKFVTRGAVLILAVWMDIAITRRAK